MKETVHHPLQKLILGQLALQGELRYSQLKPKHVEGNVFMYHLRTLLSLGLVEKTSAAYCLTTKGAFLADSFSFTENAFRLRPKVVTMTVVMHAGAILLYQRKKEPLRGLYGLPYGKLHLGEKLCDAAARELYEKTGLKADVQRIGELSSTVYKKGELLSSMIALLFIARQWEGVVNDACVWVPIDDLERYPFMPGVREIVECAISRGEEFFTLELQSDAENSVK